MAKRLSATERLRSNIKRTIRSLEKRGYRIPEELKSKVETGKYQTLKSIHRNKYSKLYGEATAEINGKIVSGVEKRQQERKESASKSRQKTKKPSTWEQERREKDKREKSIAEKYQEGDIIYANINKLIEMYPRLGATYLKNLFKSEIKNYGEQNVITALANMPVNAVEAAQNILFYETDADETHRALEEFSLMLRGAMPTEEESKELGDILDQL